MDQSGGKTLTLRLWNWFEERIGQREDLAKDETFACCCFMLVLLWVRLCLKWQAQYGVLCGYDDTTYMYYVTGTG